MMPSGQLDAGYISPVSRFRTSIRSPVRCPL